MEKTFGSLSEFKHRSVKLFRSVDPFNTSVYFTEKENKYTSQAFFDLLWFDYGTGNHEIYIKNPDQNYFVEMLGGGAGSGRGNMITSSGTNVWEKSYDKKIEIYCHDLNLLLKIGNFSSFNFLKKIAEYNKGNRFEKNPSETLFNQDELNKVFEIPYLKIPEEVRSICYCYKTPDSSKYFLVDYPAYNFKYDNHRFFIIENNKATQYTIKNFMRYKDGGTTIIQVIDPQDSSEHVFEHIFFSPTPFDKIKNKTWDDEKIIETSLIEKFKLIKLLNLEIEPDRDIFNKIKNYFDIEEFFTEEDLNKFFEILPADLQTNVENSLWEKNFKIWIKEKYPILGSSFSY